MRHLLDIADKLDLSGNYKLSDKLYKIAQTTKPYAPPIEFYPGVDKNKYNIGRAQNQGNYDQKMIALQKQKQQASNNDYNYGTQIMGADQYYNNPYTPPEILKLRNQLVDTDFRGQIYQAEKGDDRLVTSDSTSFAVSLMEHARLNKMNLVQAFDDLANHGMKYKGTKIQQVPELQELYKRISNHPGSISRQMIEQEIDNIHYELRSPFFGKMISTPSSELYQSKIDPKTGIDTGKLEYEYNQMISSAGYNDIPTITEDIDSDERLPQELKEKLKENLEFSTFKNRIEDGNFSATLLNGWKNLMPNNIRPEQKEILNDLIDNKIDQYNIRAQNANLPEGYKIP
jgi:hypothetical protein